MAPNHRNLTAERQVARIFVYREHVLKRKREHLISTSLFRFTFKRFSVFEMNFERYKLRCYQNVSVQYAELHLAVLPLVKVICTQGRDRYIRLTTLQTDWFNICKVT